MEKSIWGAYLRNKSGFLEFCLDTRLRILFVGKNHSQGLKDSDPSSFSNTARALGHEVVESLDDQPEIVICVDYKRADMKTIYQARKQKIRTTLIINEPEVVISQNSKTSVHRKFDSFIEIGRPESTPQLKWPQTWRVIDKSPYRSKSAIMVNADKWSFVSGSLYWLRAAIASESNCLDVYGYGWDRRWYVRLAHRVFELLRTIVALRLPTLEGIRHMLSRPIAYRGAVRDKVAEMSKYSVAVVIENSQELLTEKLFDAWFAGCIPVYIGPSVQKFGIPRELVVESKPNIKDLKIAIDTAVKMDRTQFVKSVEEFLATSAAKDWHARSAIRSALEVAISPDSSK